MLRFVGASKLLTQIFTFIGHIQRATVDYYMTDVARANNGLSMHRPKKKSELMNDTCIKACINKFVSGAYDRLQFLKTVSHSLGVHTPSLHDSDDEDDDEVPQHRLLPQTLQPFQQWQRPQRRHLRWQTAVKSVFWCHKPASP